MSTWLEPRGSDAEAPLALPGRVAASLFVLGRHAEHAEVEIRLLRTILGRLDEAPQDGSRRDGAGDECLAALVEALTVLSGGRWDGDAAAKVPIDRVRVLALAAVLDPDRPGSVVTCLQAVVDSSFSVREHLSGDTWQVVGEIEDRLARLRRRPPTTLLAAEQHLAGVKRALLALAGLALESMVRDDAWRFVDSGRRIERARALATVVGVALVPVRPTEVEHLLFESVMRAFESLMTYRRRYRSSEDLETVLQELLFDVDNPRSLAFGLAELTDSFAALPRPDAPGRLNDEERLLLDAATGVRLGDPYDLQAVDPASGRRSMLAGLLRRTTGLLDDVAATLDARYFEAPSQHLLAEVHQ